MSTFVKFEKRVREALKGYADLTFELGRPVRDDGIWTLSIFFPDGFEVEVGYNRHRGFGLSSGADLQFGSGFDELFDDDGELLDRIVTLAAERIHTDAAAPLRLGELRRTLGIPQAELATIVGITKGGMAQLENDQAIETMKVETVEKVLHGLGARLVMLAEFPDGRSRRIRMGWEPKDTAIAV